MNNQAKNNYLPIHIANYLLWLADRDNKNDITPMKLLKLAYFCYAWYLALSGRKLFAEKIEAWKFGPVIPSLYHEFKRFGNRNITQYAEYYEDHENGEPKYLMIDRNDKNVWGVAAAVWEHYKDKTAAQLSAITHEADSPWTEAYVSGRHQPLQDKKIRARAQQAIDEYLTARRAA